MDTWNHHGYDSFGFHRYFMYLLSNIRAIFWGSMSNFKGIICPGDFLVNWWVLWWSGELPKKRSSLDFVSLHYPKTATKNPEDGPKLSPKENLGNPKAESLASNKQRNGYDANSFCQIPLTRRCCASYMAITLWTGWSWDRLLLPLWV